MSKANEAVELFNQGFNCAQAVFAAYSEELGLDAQTALKTASSFGGGMGRQGLICGAVTGAYMLIGQKYGKVSVEDQESKGKNYELVQEFSKRFIERNGSLTCKDLIGLDLITGDKAAIAERVNVVCTKAVRDSAEIIKELLKI